LNCYEVPVSIISVFACVSWSINPRPRAHIPPTPPPAPRRASRPSSPPRPSRQRGALDVDAYARDIRPRWNWAWTWWRRGEHECCTPNNRPRTPAPVADVRGLGRGRDGRRRRDGDRARALRELRRARSIRIGATRCVVSNPSFFSLCADATYATRTGIALPRLPPRYARPAT
jgi:hypothetical protein